MLQRRQAPVDQQPFALSDRSPPRLAMPGGPTGVWAAIGTASGQDRRRLLGIRGAGEAEGGRRIEEAVVKEADVQCTAAMGEHSAQPAAIHDPAGQIAKLVLHASKLPLQSYCARSGRTFLANERFAMGDDIVELTECALALDCEAEVSLA
ncbi:hypothetical protein LJR235_005302 [Pararhizobium sp. LjRoot235]|uniref:hypothetical protein n=1 Tax=Pararhizobium sp. LjRoot235 TaxID=3342291 RepID=UPI003ECEC98A